MRVVRDGGKRRAIREHDDRMADLDRGHGRDARHQRGRVRDHADATTLRVGGVGVEVPRFCRRREYHQQQAEQRRPADEESERTRVTVWIQQQHCSLDALPAKS